MAKSGGAVSTGAATRLAHVIGMLKWVVIVAIVVWVALMSAAGLSNDTSIFGAFVVLFWIYGLVASIATYVLLGWLQQTLLMLVGIAKNTAQRSRADTLSRLVG